MMTFEEWWKKEGDPEADPQPCKDAWDAALEAHGIKPEKKSAGAKTVLSNAYRGQE